MSQKRAVHAPPHAQKRKSFFFLFLQFPKLSVKTTRRQANLTTCRLPISIRNGVVWLVPFTRFSTLTRPGSVQVTCLKRPFLTTISIDPGTDLLQIQFPMDPWPHFNPKHNKTILRNSNMYGQFQLQKKDPTYMQMISKNSPKIMERFYGSFSSSKNYQNWAKKPILKTGIQTTTQPVQQMVFFFWIILIQKIALKINVCSYTICYI